MSIRILVRTAAVALALAGAPALAQNCSGFTDVPAGDLICPSVEWLKNRGITAGCTATTYCPNNNVTRGSMALFMNRMGNAMTPVLLEPIPNVDSVAQVNLATPAVVCPTGDYIVSGFPRRAHFTGRVNLYQPSAAGAFVVDVVYTDDGTANWKSVQYSSAYIALSPALTSDDITVAPNGFLNLDVGTTYRFALRVARNSGAANAAIYCTNFVTIGNRVVTASPFDAADYMPPADVPPPQGRALPRE
jgi:hypothetical protein